MSNRRCQRRIRNHRLSVLGLIPTCLVLLLTSCMDAFFPPTGAPPNVGVPNSPKEVIDQLKKSYETRSVPLFRDLLADDYRFYVSPTFASQYSASKGLRSDSLSDTFAYVPSEVYHYWSRDEELRAHEQMFAAAEDIQFTSAPSYDEDTYYYHMIRDTLAIDSVYDSLGLFDSLMYTIDIDTTGAEVEMRGGEIVLQESNNGPTHTVNIEYQVFYMEPEKKRWKIVRWFDLGRSPN